VLNGTKKTTVDGRHCLPDLNLAPEGGTIRLMMSPSRQCLDEVACGIYMNRLLIHLSRLPSLVHARQEAAV